jgi:hypothetical protein
VLLVVAGVGGWEDGRLVVSACLHRVSTAFRGGQEVQLAGVMR